jgi:hypothetical protein
MNFFFELTQKVTNIKIIILKHFALLIFFSNMGGNLQRFLCNKLNKTWEFPKF